MPRRFRLAIAMLPLAFAATATTVHAIGSPPSAAGPRMSRPAHADQREASPLPARQRNTEMPPTHNAERFAPPPAPDRRAISDAVRQVRRSTGGQILGAEQVPYEGRNITRVKYMDDRGRVRYMDMDEHSGAGARREPQRSGNKGP